MKCQLAQLLSVAALAAPVIAQSTTSVSVDSAGNQGDLSSNEPSISADGRYVAFLSQATNLVPGDTNGVWDVFVHDRQTGSTTRVNVDSSGNQANQSTNNTPALSADGRQASNLVLGDTNGFRDIFVHDRQTGQTTRVSVDSAGNEANGSSFEPAMSGDGRYVAFRSDATNLLGGNGPTQVVLHDRQSGQTEVVSIDSNGNQASANAEGPPSLSMPRLSASQRRQATLCQVTRTGRLMSSFATAWPGKRVVLASTPPETRGTGTVSSLRSRETAALWPSGAKRVTLY